MQALEPTGKPIGQWNGIPIMAGAISGGQDAYSYRYTIKATPDAIHTFYDQQMPKGGWQPLAVSTGQNQSTLLTYSGSNGILTITLYDQADGTTLVMLVIS